MTNESEIADWKNYPTLESSFVATLVEWHRNGAWDKFQKGRSNWHYLTLHMNDKCQVNLKWEQYRSKFYRLESEWKCFIKLNGMSGSTAETGVGFNSELLCFQATREKWSALTRVNLIKLTSADTYDLLTALLKFFGKFAWGLSYDNSCILYDTLLNFS